MTDNYEFRYQSTKQKVILFALKLLVMLMIFQAVHSLATGFDVTLEDKLSSAGGVFIGFWMYVNLLRVKIEVQELFVPPVNILHGKEFLFVGGVLVTYSDVLVVIDIYSMLN